MKNVCLRVLCLLLPEIMLHGADHFVEKHVSDANGGKFFPPKKHHQRRWQVAPSR